MTQTILIVEDNALSGEMLKRRLESRGYRIVLATTGEQAIEWVTSEKPNLILMDLSLPLMDGLAATRCVKSMSDIPVIALTAQVIEGEEMRAKLAGCDDYDTKPIDLVRLLNKIKQLID